MGSTSDAGKVERAASTGEFLEVDEIVAACKVMAPDDKLKLMAVERVLLGGTGRQVKELLAEALYRVSCGSRRCPRHVPVIAFLIETMRSISSHDRERQKRQKKINPDDADTVERVRILPGALASDVHNPEEALLRREAAEEPSAVDTIYGHFDGDEEAQLLIMGWAEGLRGEKLRDFIGVDQACLDYVGKKVRRKIMKLYPNGFSR
jgi:hypothetical protein